MCECVCGCLWVCMCGCVCVDMFVDLCECVCVCVWHVKNFVNLKVTEEQMPVF